MSSGYQPWANPDPQSVAGLNSAMIYGENIAVVAGLNHQIALGSNLQFCINPSVLFEMLGIPGSATLSSLFGSGLGGNMQFTIGSNTNIVWGRQFQITMGPEQVTIDANSKKPFAITMCALIGAAALGYAIGYGLCKDEDGRATAVVIFQIVMDLLLAVFMIQMMAYKTIDNTTSDDIRILVGANTDTSGHPIPRSTTLQDLASALAFVVAMGALITPPIAVAVEEGHFQGETQSK
ncbi:MAG TPA: hypothetical protein VMT15_22660 [Bryobacteraceae bacterium]|nr:hypothetical protein [Bryobacteraceae bacterium]